MAYTLIGIMGLVAAYVHIWWLPSHGVSGWTGEPREKYYALLKVPQRSRAHRRTTSMISRHWKGTIKPGLANHYLEHLRTQTLPQLAAISGFVSVTILRREVADGTEFQIVTVWTSIDSIRAFAGDDPEVAVVPPAAQALMTTFDRRAVHYEVVETAGA